MTEKSDRRFYSDTSQCYTNPPPTAEYWHKRAVGGREAIIKAQQLIACNSPAWTVLEAYLSETRESFREENRNMTESTTLAHSILDDADIPRRGPFDDLTIGDRVSILQARYASLILEDQT